MNRLIFMRIGFTWLVCLGCVFGTPLPAQNVDVNMLKSINPQNPGSDFWKGATNSYVIVAGTASLGTLAYSLIKDDRKLRYKSYELLMALGINILVTDGLKAVVNRARPAETYPNDIYVLSVSKGGSFPSGHTSQAFATATSLTLTHKKWYVAVPAYLWAGCVGYSRIYLGRHYPSDVLGGAAVGAGSSILSHWLTKKLFPQKDKSTRENNKM
jgi:membrane-associated phospholipid phosphatase